MIYFRGLLFNYSTFISGDFNCRMYLIRSDQSNRTRSALNHWTCVTPFRLSPAVGCHGNLLVALWIVPWITHAVNYANQVIMECPWFCYTTRSMNHNTWLYSKNTTTDHHYVPCDRPHETTHEYQTWNSRVVAGHASIINVIRQTVCTWRQERFFYGNIQYQLVV